MGKVNLTQRVNGVTYRLTAPSPKYKSYPPYVPIKEALKQVERYRKVGHAVRLTKVNVNGKEYGLLYVCFACDLKR